MRSLFRTRGWTIALTVSALSSTLLLGRQTGESESAGKTFTITDNVNMVLLFASVRDPNGGYVSGLKKGDFTVSDDGARQVITQFGDADAPVSVGLVVDDSGSMRSKRAEVVLAGLSFARQSNARDEFFVVNFNNYVVNGLGPAMPFTDNLQRLRSALYFGTPIGQTALYDAVAHALAHLERSHHQDRTLIVVSDGGDNVSKTSLAEVLNLIQASRATVYTIGLYDQFDRDQNPRVLRKFSKISGGEFFQPESLNDIIPIFEKISSDIRSRYTIGYVPPGAVDVSTPVVRTIKVGAVNGKGRKLIVRTRTSYTNVPFTDVFHDRELQANMPHSHTTAANAVREQ
jgi:Ca-activated chloride channel family protein